MRDCHRTLGRFAFFLLLATALGACAATAWAGGPAATADDPAGLGAAGPANDHSAVVRLLEWLGVPLRPAQSPVLRPADRATAERTPASGAAAYVEPYWQPLTAVPRANHSAVYDPVRGRVIVLVGARLFVDNSPYYAGGAQFYADAQALDLGGSARWEPLATLPGGERRDEAAAIYDAANDRVLLHGGFFIGPVDGPPGYYCHAFDDLWELKLSPAPQWSEIKPAGPAPSPRFGHTGIYDPLRKRALLFGGTEHLWSATYCWSNTPLADLWELSLDGAPAWHPLAESGDVPPAGVQGTALYDARRDRMLFVARDSVWAMTLDPAGSWTQLAVANPDTLGPDGPAVLDPARDRLLSVSASVTWELPLAGPLVWRRVPVSGAGPASALRGYSLTWDPQGDRLVFHGGVFRPEPWGTVPSDETWFLVFGDSPHWELAPPVRRELVMHKTVYDPVGDRVIAIGGDANPGLLAFPLEHPGAWVPLATAGGGPPRTLIGHGAVYDAKRARVLVFGGTNSLVTSPQDATLALSLAGTPRWTLLQPDVGEGQATLLGSLVLDTRRDRLLSFGGMTWAGAVTNEVWQLRLADPEPKWERLETVGTPPAPRLAHGAIYDPVRDRMIVEGGLSPDQAEPCFGDLWTLSLEGTPQWTLLDANAPCNYGQSMLYDPVRDYLLMMFGAPEECSVAMAWDLEHSVWIPLDFECFGGGILTPAPRLWQAASYDPVRDQVVVSGGMSINGTYLYADVWALVFGTPVRDVAIDIRPGSEENVVNPGANGALPVAILSDATFDATSVDPLTVKLAGAAVRLKNDGSPVLFRQDVNGDGRTDLVLHLESSGLELTPTDTVARLTAMAPGNTTVRGSDHVRVVGNARPPKLGPGPLAAEVAAAPALLAVRCLPGSGLRVSLAIAPGAPASLDLLDIAGRRVRSLALDGGSGPREVKLGDGALSPGVYWVRLRQAGAVLTRKAVVLR